LGVAERGLEHSVGHAVSLSNMAIGASTCDQSFRSQDGQFPCGLPRPLGMQMTDPQ
jgi:hypothetical protein